MFTGFGALEVEFVWKLTPAFVLVGLVRDREQTPAFWWGSLLDNFVQVGLGLLVLVLVCFVALLFAAVGEFAWKRPQKPRLHGKTSLLAAGLLLLVPFLC